MPSGARARCIATPDTAHRPRASPSDLELHLADHDHLVAHRCDRLSIAASLAGDDLEQASPDLLRAMVNTFAEATDGPKPAATWAPTSSPEPAALPSRTAPPAREVYAIEPISA